MANAIKNASTFSFIYKTYKIILYYFSAVTLLREMQYIIYKKKNKKTRLVPVITRRERDHERVIRPTPKSSNVENECDGQKKSLKSLHNIYI